MFSTPGQPNYTSSIMVMASALVASSSHSFASGFRPTPVEERIAAHLDRDSDGLFSPSEIDRFPAPMREWLGESDIGERPMSVAEFAPTLRRILQDLRGGAHSAPSRRSASGAEDRTNSVGRPAAGTAPRADRESVRTAEYVFRLMDRNRDLKLDGEEWRRSQTVRPWFEDAGVRFPGEMSRAEFVNHLVRMHGDLD